MENTQSPKQCSQSLQQTADFAALCHFITHFGDYLGIHLTFPQLIQLLETDESENGFHLAPLQIKLLNKLKFRARVDNWEIVLVRFLDNHSAAVDRLSDVKDVLQTSSFLSTFTGGFEQSNGVSYYAPDALVRAKVLLCLLEAQFDRNVGFKDKINMKSPADLRYRPLGYDVWGRVYWLLKDSECNILLYREDNETHSFELVCQTTNEMRHLHSKLTGAYQPSTALIDIFHSMIGNKKKDGMTNDVDDGNAAVSSVELQVDGAPASDVLADGQPHGDTPDVVIGLSNQPPYVLAPPSTPIPVASQSPMFSDPLIKEHANSATEQPVEHSYVISSTVKPEENVAGSSTTRLLNGSPRESPTADITSVSHVKQPKPSIKIDEPAIIAPDPEETETPPPVKQEECLPEPRALKKKGHPSKPGVKCIPEAVDGESALELRRSGRQRKPVEFLTMEPIQPKRSRVLQKTPSSVIENDCAAQIPTAAPAVGNRKRSHKRKPKTGEIQPADSSHVKDSKQTIRKDKKKKHRKGKRKSRLGQSVWHTRSSSDSSDGIDDYFEQALLEHDQANSDATCDHNSEHNKSNSAWLDQPESDFNLSDISDTSDADSLTQGRNLARQKRLRQKAVSDNGAVVKDTSLSDEQHQCQVCMQSHLPEWILLCDRCDLGHHAMCIHPALMLIPEGDWYCPRCQHAALVATLEESADAIDAEQKKQTVWRRMQERLNFVNISMTNILTDKDNEIAKDRRRQVSSNTKQSSDETSIDNGLSQSDSCSDESYSGGGRRKFRNSRQRRMLKQQKSNRDSRSRRTRISYAQYSEDEDFNSSRSSDRYIEPAPRAARQSRTFYGMKEAFKIIDAAIEDDEKYQEEKRQRKQRKHNTCDAGETVSIHASPGKSHGKDLSNILGPDWKDEDGTSRPPRNTDRRSRLSSSETSEDEAQIFGGSKKRRRGSDSDFHPADGSSVTSDSATDVEESDGKIPDSASSDGSWLCAARRRGKSRRRSGARRTSGKRRRGRPIPRFEANDDDDIEADLKRPRRSACAVVSYRETWNDDEDADENDNNYPKRRHVHLDSDSVEEIVLKPEELVDSTKRSANSVSHNGQTENHHRRRRVLSSSSQSNPSDAAVDDEKVVNSKKEVVKPVVSHCNKIKTENVEMASPSEDNYFTSALVISETSPSGYQPTVSPKTCVAAPQPSTAFDGSDEDCVEGDGDDLLSLHHRSFPKLNCVADPSHHNVPPVVQMNHSGHLPDISPL